MKQLKFTLKNNRTTSRNQFMQNTVKMISISAIALVIVGIFYAPAFIGAAALGIAVGVHFVSKIVGYVGSVCCGDAKYSISLEEIIADLDRANG